MQMEALQILRRNKNFHFLVSEIEPLWQKQPTDVVINQLVNYLVASN